MDVLVIAYPGCVFHEISAAVNLLADGRELRVATRTGDPLRPQEGFQLGADLSFGQVEDAPAVTLVPGGDCAPLLDDAVLHGLLRRIHTDGGTIGAICNGVFALGAAGLLDGRRCTHTATPRWADPDQFAELIQKADEVFADATYVDDHVVIDGRLVTAKPWAPDEFAVTVGEVAGWLDPDAAARRRAYYQRTRPH